MAVAFDVTAFFVFPTKFYKNPNGRGCKCFCIGVMLPIKEGLQMIRYKMRKDRLVSEDGVKYIAYGVDAYEGLRKVKSIKDITLDKRQMAKQIKVWNRCHIGLNHLEQVVQSFVDNDYEAEEKPYSQV